MGMTNGTIWQDLQWRYRYGGNITRLIMINVAVFLVVKLTMLIADWMLGTGLGQQFFRSLTMSSNPADLLHKPWSLLTHMFTHTGFFHLLFNMLILYWFGVIFKDFIGEPRMVPVYLLGGLTGIALYLLAYNTLPAFEGVSGMAFGASAGVMAILVATSTMVPNFSLHLLFLGAVRLKWIALALVVIDLLSIPEGNSGGRIAHLGGALFGYLFALQYKQGNDWTRPFFGMWDGLVRFFDFSSKPGRKRRSRSRMRTVFRNEGKARAAQGGSAQPGGGEEARDKQQKIDEILDKISSSGYDSLTSEEKAFLFRMSKE